LALKAGTTTNITYSTQSTVGGIVSPPGSFIAESLLFSEVLLDGKTVLKGETKSRTLDFAGRKVGEAQATSYSVRSGLLETTLLRLEASASSFDFQGNISATSTGIAVYSPGFVDSRPSMALGSMTEEYQKGTRTSTFTPPGNTITETIDTTSVVKFAAIENINIPAGTYLACRFEQFDKAFPTSIATFWFTYGVGVFIKGEIKSPMLVNVQEATSILVNGKKV
jgi:hypothetical protein